MSDRLSRRPYWVNLVLLGGVGVTQLGEGGDERSDWVSWTSLGSARLTHSTSAAAQRGG